MVRFPSIGRTTSCSETTAGVYVSILYGERNSHPVDTGCDDAVPHSNRAEKRRQFIQNANISPNAARRVSSKRAGDSSSLPAEHGLCAISSAAAAVAEAVFRLVRDCQIIVLACSQRRI